MKLLQNPLIKLIGIVAIIYFALFADKRNPASLGNRVSLERVKENLGEMEEKGKFIAGNVKAAREYAKTKIETSKEAPVEQKQEEQQNISQPEKLSQDNQKQAKMPISKEKIMEDKIILNDVALGAGDKVVSCGSEVEIVSASGAQIAAAPEKLIIGSKKNWVIEKNIIGMKMGGFRSITIPLDFKTNDKKLKKILDSKKTALVYQIIVTNLKDPKAKSGKVCK